MKNSNDSTQLNDLANIRTVLANERTLLAYIRTALTLFIAGISFIEFFKINRMQILGWIFIGIGVIILFIGIYRYEKTKVIIRAQRAQRKINSI